MLDHSGTAGVIWIFLTISITPISPSLWALRHGKASKSLGFSAHVVSNKGRRSVSTLIGRPEEVALVARLLATIPGMNGHRESYNFISLQ